MLRFKKNVFKDLRSFKIHRLFSTTPEIQVLPESAEVVIIGGGSAGCNVLYQLAKKNVKAVLLERAQVTSGTTWHTAGLVWRLRPNDVEIQLLATTRNLLMSLEEECGHNSGWIQNGGLFISHSEQRTNEYKRLSTLGKCFGIESHMLSPLEAQKVFPLLDPKSFENSLFSPGDGTVDPAMMCNALIRSAAVHGAKVFENCPVQDLVVGQNMFGKKDVRGVILEDGRTIRTNTVVNATGVWGNDLLQKHGILLPLVPMKHAYVVSESIKEVRNLPNIRDHDFSLYFRIQGESICMGGYENNPSMLKKVDKDFQFGLYELDYSNFETHIDGAVKLCPAFGNAGIKSTICGPESFTPDHKPLMGPDPYCTGLFHNVGFNSAGMMLGAGCAKELAAWIINDRPDLHMFPYDIRRFTPMQRKAPESYATSRSHESYAKNYSIVFPNDQPLAGRNFIKDPFHDTLLTYGAVMEEKSGWERPGYYLKDGQASVQPYDWYGFYGNKKNENTCYTEKLAGEYSFDFSDHHDTIGEEAVSCRNNAVLFNLSYFCKVFLTGSQAEEAAKWIFTGDLDKPVNKTIYTCALNDQGGVEADMTITPIESGVGELHDPIFKGRGYYIIAGGASMYQSISHLRSAIQEKSFRAKVTDVTEKLGVLSIQGPNSRDILSKITDYDLSNESIAPNSAAIIKIKGNNNATFNVRLLRVSFVGELGFELHIPKEVCLDVYHAIMSAGGSFGLRNGGYRSLYALSSEKGYHLWGFDLRTDDSPIEANLGFTCRKNGDYKGKKIVDQQKKNGVLKRLVFLTLNEQIPLWGLEAVYRNGELVGHLRRGDYGFSLQTPIGQSYIKRPDNKPVDAEYIKSGKYQIEIMGNMHDATCHLRSPFDVKGKRIFGDYK